MQATKQAAAQAGSASVRVARDDVDHLLCERLVGRQAHCFAHRALEVLHTDRLLTPDQPAHRERGRQSTHHPHGRLSPRTATHREIRYRSRDQRQGRHPGDPRDQHAAQRRDVQASRQDFEARLANALEQRQRVR